MCFITILSSSLNVILIVNKHASNVCCGEFPVPQTDRKSKQVKQHSDIEHFIWNQYGELRIHTKGQALWYVESGDICLGIYRFELQVFVHIYLISTAHWSLTMASSHSHSQWGLRCKIKTSACKQRQMGLQATGCSSARICVWIRHHKALK